MSKRVKKMLTRQTYYITLEIRYCKWYWTC